MRILKVRFWFVVALFMNLSSIGYCQGSSSTTQPQNETVTIVTYYPTPNGVYNNVITQKIVVGDYNADGKVDYNDVINKVPGQAMIGRSLVFRPYTNVQSLSNPIKGEVVFNGTSLWINTDGTSTGWKQIEGTGTASGSKCYVSYSGLCTAPGFSSQTTLGEWGTCTGCPTYGDYFRPAGVDCKEITCTRHKMGDAVLCCQD
jgi:hypothetical protein